MKDLAKHAAGPEMQAKMQAGPGPKIEATEG